MDQPHGAAMTSSRKPLAMVVGGARPNFVKVAPILRAMEDDGRLRARFVHTGQHYDPAMSDVFFRELGIRTAMVNLGVGSGSHSRQTGAVMVGLERLVENEMPDIIVTVGDVNSTLAAALVAAKTGVPQAHVEAGLRSGDAYMPEEVNRVVADRLADLLFTHSDEADCNLRDEGVPSERIHAVGNVMIDTLNRLRPVWQGAAAVALTEIPREYGVVTLHRPSNVDDPVRLDRITNALMEAADQIPLIFPVHPRTRVKLPPVDRGRLRLVEPLGYLSFLDLVEHARFVVTDSGGLQEETTVLGVPCLTLRDTTERPVTLRLGTNHLLGTDPAAVARAVTEVLSNPPAPSRVPPLWDGHASERIVAVLCTWLAGPRSLRLSR
jgi:UDP-N-acetylglucosamine 2-epimerase (non-hydrolysing)